MHVNAAALGVDDLQTQNMCSLEKAIIGCWDNQPEAKQSRQDQCCHAPRPDVLVYGEDNTSPFLC